VSAMLDVRDMYLDLLRSSLTRYGEDELAPIRASNHPMARRVFGSLAKRDVRLVRAIPFDEKKWNLGLDWPVSARWRSLRVDHSGP
jgi:hypothetical protein